MAFIRANLAPVGGPGGGYLGSAPKVWTYKTADAVGDVDGAQYFADAADLLKVGDIVIRVTVTNLGASNEAASTGGFHLVNSSSISAGAGTVDVANVLALTTTDSD